MAAQKTVRLTGFGGTGFGLSTTQGVTENWTAIYEICTPGKCATDPRCLIRDAQQNEYGNLLPSLGELWPPLPGSGDDASYYESCDNNSAAFVTAVAPGSYTEKDGCCCLQVVVTYATLPSTQGQFTLDPIQQCPRLETYEVEESEVVTNAYFFGIFESPDEKPNCGTCTDDSQISLQDISNSGVTRSKNTCGPVINSAGQVANPPYERTRRLKGYRITASLAFYDPATFECYEGTINCDEYTISIPCLNFFLTIPKFHGMLVSVLGRPAEFFDGTANIAYWEVTWDILTDPEGFCKDYLNQGTQRLACNGAPDGCGGELGSADNPAGNPAAQTITDLGGFQVTEPVPLNEEGQPIQCGDSKWYLRYCLDPCTDHRDVLI